MDRPRKARARRRVLLVDDDPMVRSLLRAVLLDSDFDLDEASDGDEALRLAHARAPDVVVLDVMMPVLDGWGVLDSLRERATAPPVLVVSAKSSWDDIVRAVEGGAADYLAKPFQTEELIAAVARLVDADHRDLEQRRSELLGE